MTKFGSKYGSTRGAAKSPIKSTTTVTTNHGGAPAFERDPKSDLFLLGVMNFVGEDTFYESAETRDDRFVQLVRTVTKQDPEWVQNFIPWLRNEANMRSASVVAAIEYVKAGGPNGRSVINSALLRADEPAEVLAYWIGTYGRPIPSSVKRGVGDAARRLYTEKSIVKYDGNSKKFRFADVIQLAHVKPKDDQQSALFKYALDTRYGGDADTSVLTRLSAVKSVNKGEVDRERLLTDPDFLRKSGITWEALSGLGPMDARAWNAIIPTMGYMALLRNLRNFEQAGISPEMTQFVINKLSDPEEVGRSRQLPFRFWSAYKNTNSLQWAHALEQALTLSTRNLPALGGRTLLLVDSSASMRDMGLSAKSTVTPLDAAAIFGTALALKGENVDLHPFASTVDRKLDLAKGGSILRGVEALRARVGVVGHGTNIPQALQQWNGHDRVVLISDMQTLGCFENRNVERSRWRYYTPEVNSARDMGIPSKVPVFAFSLQGYGGAQVGNDNEYELGGLTDHTFKMIQLLEKGRAAKWPWEN